jgi:hypothetical protein
VVSRGCGDGIHVGIKYLSRVGIYDTDNYRQ